jgi:hypothetical protein
MGLLNRIFRSDAKGADSVPPLATRFQDADSEAENDQEARLNVRRELVQVTLREAMRRHAVPSDWLDLRMLPVVNRKGKHGMHVQLVVKQGQGSLLAYIPSFQSSFMAEIEKFEPRAWDWLLSISWQFTGISSTSAGEEPRAVTAPTPLASAPAQPQPAAAPVDDEVAQDLKALFAIRDAALQQAQDPPDFEPTRPGR